MTDRARVASLPNETPVEDLPLRAYTINRLRVGGVLTLGQLRAMSDSDLLRLRWFGSRRLADVRALVPRPEGKLAVSADAEVTIAGRTFRLGVAYAPRAGVGINNASKPRRLLDYSPDGPLPGGRVDVAILPSGARRVLAGAVWAAWAGEAVEG